MRRQTMWAWRKHILRPQVLVMLWSSRCISLKSKQGLCRINKHIVWISWPSCTSAWYPSRELCRISFVFQKAELKLKYIFGGYLYTVLHIICAYAMYVYKHAPHPQVRCARLWRIEFLFSFSFTYTSMCIHYTSIPQKGQRQHTQLHVHSQANPTVLSMPQPSLM